MAETLGEAFPIGIWNSTSSSTVPFSWAEAQPGRTLADTTWRLEPFEAAVMSYIVNVRNDKHLPTTSDPLGFVPPIAAIYLSFDMLQSAFQMPRTMVDVAHELAWVRPLRNGATVRAHAELVAAWQHRGRGYLRWQTTAADGKGVVFSVGHIVSVREPIPPENLSTDASHMIKHILTPHAPLHELHRREVQCSLAWSRRGPYPPQPNLHTDEAAARAAGFDGPIMGGVRMASQLLEAIVEFDESLFYGSTISYRMRRPVPVDALVVASILRHSEQGEQFGLQLATAGDERTDCILGILTKVRP